MSCDFNCTNCSLCQSKEPTNKILDSLKAQIPDAESTFEYDELYHSRPYRVLLGLTSNCNLRCPYCFTCRNQDKMDLTTARKAVELTIKNFKESKDPNKDAKPTVTFFGGEPTLEYESVIVPLINEFKDTIDWSITTNGVLLNEDMVDFFWENKVQILLSFDGLEVIQNTQRPGAGFDSYKTIMKNIPYLLVRYPEIAVRSTLTVQMIPYLYETYLMLEELGFQRWFCAANTSEQWSLKEAEIARKEINKIGAHILNKVLRPDDYPVLLFEPITRLIQDFHAVRKGQHYFDNGVMRCGMGTTTFSVDPHGDIVPCQEELTAPKNKIGSIYKNENQIDPILHKSYLKNYFNNIQKVRETIPLGNLDNYSVAHRVVCPSRLLQNNFEKESTDILYHECLMEAASRLYHLTRGSILPQVLNITGERFEYNLSEEIIEIPLLEQEVKNAE